LQTLSIVNQSDRDKVFLISVEPISDSALFLCDRSASETASLIKSAMSKLISEISSLSADFLKKTAVFVLSIHEAINFAGLASVDEFLKTLTSRPLACVVLEHAHSQLSSPQAGALIRSLCDVSVIVEDRQGVSLESQEFFSGSGDDDRVVFVVAEAFSIRRSRSSGRVIEDSCFLALCKSSKGSLFIKPLRSGRSTGSAAIPASSVEVDLVNAQSRSSSSSSSVHKEERNLQGSAVGSGRVPIIVFDKSDQELETAEDDDDGTLDDDLDL
jgi:hypothetical protein